MVSAVVFVLIHLAFIHLLKINSIIAISQQRKKKSKQNPPILPAKPEFSSLSLASPHDVTIVSPKLNMDSTLISPGHNESSRYPNESSYFPIIRPNISAFMEVDSSFMRSTKIKQSAGDMDGSFFDIPPPKLNNMSQFNQSQLLSKIPQDNVKEDESIDKSPMMRRNREIMRFDDKSPNTRSRDISRFDESDMSKSPSHKRKVLMPSEMDEIKKQIELAKKQQRVLEVYQIERAEDYNTEYELILADYKKESLRTNSYSIFFLIRFTCYSFLIVFMRKNPFFQIFFMEYINFLFILYLILDQPFGSRLKFIFALILEIFVFYLLAFPLVLVYLDMRAQLDGETKIKIGELFIQSYFYFTIAIIVLIVLGIIKTLYDKRKLKKMQDKMKESRKSQHNKIAEDIQKLEVKTFFESFYYYIF